MLSQQDNEIATRIGPGTVMGSFLREYWVPIALSSEFPTPDCPPVRLMVLGERLIGFRDSSGQMGVVANLCPHRGASLFFGRNEEGGLRCVYHGWKFDVHGACVDMPNEPPESNFRRRVQISAYPCTERGGLVWAYLGSRADPPALPGLEATLLPTGAYDATAHMRPCNWLQALEGDIDNAHVAVLHGGEQEPDYFTEGTFEYFQIKHRSARFAVVDTDFGVMYGSYRPGRAGSNYWRIGQFLFPFWTSPGGGVLGNRIGATCWVPMDDTHTMVFNVNPLKRRNNQGGAQSDGYYLENTSDWFGRFRLAQNEGNDYHVDREEQRNLGSFTGIPGDALPEDIAMQVSMGPTADRSQEHLGSSDLMVVRTRRRILQAAQAFAEEGVSPPALDRPESYGVRAGGLFIPEEENWVEYVEQFLPAFVDHPDLDLSVVGEARVKGRRHLRVAAGWKSSEGETPW
jgi:phthalate 4,5-dioxygenase oxygenase subunit